MIKGIAIYIPTSYIGDGYLDLQWSKYSNWDEMITWYMAKDEQWVKDKSIGGKICKWVLRETLDTIWDEIKQEYVVKPVKKWIEECEENNDTHYNNPGYGGNPIHNEQVKTGK